MSERVPRAAGGLAGPVRGSFFGKYSRMQLFWQIQPNTAFFGLPVGEPGAVRGGQAKGRRRAPPPNLLKCWSNTGQKLLKC